jgi:hypothetical protein
MPSEISDCKSQISNLTVIRNEESFASEENAPMRPWVPSTRTPLPKLSTYPTSSRLSVTVSVISIAPFLIVVIIPLLRYAGFQTCLRERFQIGQADLKVFADHLVAIDEQAHHFSDVGLRSMHGPRDIG